MKNYSLLLIVSCWFVSSYGLPTNETKRIIGGESVNIEEYPYYVYLRAGKYECGGTLVKLNRVITAGHCVWKIPTNEIFVYTGLRNRAALNSTTRYPASSVHIHGSYTGNPSPFFDIAVIKIGSNVAISSRVKTIPVAILPPLILSTVTVVGYGNTVCSNDGNGVCKYAGSNTLQRTNVRVIGYALHVMITRGPDTSPCNGDSGGPIVYNKQLVGLVSTGEVFCNGTNYEVSVAHPLISVFLLTHL